MSDGPRDPGWLRFSEWTVRRAKGGATRLAEAARRREVGGNAWEALAAGELDLAESRASELLASAAGDARSGDKLNVAHSVLGHVAFRRDDLDTAETGVSMRRSTRRRRRHGARGMVRSYRAMRGGQHVRELRLRHP
jgi:hypothetical protein